MTRFLRETQNWLRNSSSTSIPILSKRSFAAALFLLILGVSACKKENDEIGLDLQPESDLLNILQTDTVTLVATTVREDSLRCDELSQSLLGNNLDPNTGLTRASIYTQLRLSTPDHDFGTNPVADSLILSMKYTEESWGTIRPQYFEVLRMTEDYEIDSAYYTNRDFEFDPVNLIIPGNETQTFRPEQSINIDGDSLGPQARFPLDVGLAQELVEAGADIYDTNDNWLDFFKGLHIRSTSGQGGIVNLDLVDGATVMRLHYHNDTDTTFFDYVINSVTGRMNRFEHSYAGDLQVLNQGEDANGDVRNWVKAGAGCKTQITFPYLDELNKVEGRTINKAELFLPVNAPFDSRAPYQELLFALTVDENGNAVGLPGQLSSIIDIGGNYESFGNRYRFNITRWVQNYLNGEQAVNYINLVSNNAGISARTVGINGPHHSETDSTLNMRLVLTYSN